MQTVNREVGETQTGTGEGITHLLIEEPAQLTTELGETTPQRNVFDRLGGDFRHARNPGPYPLWLGTAMGLATL